MSGGPRWARFGVLLLAGCCPDDPRKHPDDIVEVTRSFAGKVDRYRALGGFRTREEFTRAFLERYIDKMEEERRLKPDQFFHWEAERLRTLETGSRQNPK